MEHLTPQRLLRLISIGTNLIYVVSDNERRSEWLVAQVAPRLKGVGSPYVWTCTEGLRRDGVVVDGTREPEAAIDFARNEPGPLLLLFKDLAWFWRDNPFIIRKLKDFAAQARSKALVVIGRDEMVPEGLREDLTVLVQGLPTLKEVRTFLDQQRGRAPLLSAACEADPDLLGKLTVACAGLDLIDIERAVRSVGMAKSADGATIVRTFFDAKRDVVRKGGIMEYVDNDAGPEQLGGMENLKQWLTRREQAFGLENLAAGINLPKGVLIMGIAGCGKSLFVKAIAAQWKLPLIRLDMAAVYGGSHGLPEAGLRTAFATAEAVAPCVLWIDEIESGISSQGFKAEGGVASRILGSFLTWMQEKRAPVFVAATANAIEMLPAEVLRKGRFDEIFYVGLPDAKGREEIFRIHLRKQRVDADQFDVPLLAGSTRGFSGAEVEQAVQSAVFEALADHRPLSQQDVMTAISRTVPISVTMAEQIKKIEAWAFKRAVPAAGTVPGR